MLVFFMKSLLNELVFFNLVCEENLPVPAVAFDLNWLHAIYLNDNNILTILKKIFKIEKIF